MKTILLLMAVSSIILSGCASTPPKNEDIGFVTAADFADFLADSARTRESGNFSDTGAIALHEGGYRFTVILVKDLEWALESLKIADYGLPHISQFKRGEKVTPFLTFMTFNNLNVDLTYSVILQGPDGKFKRYSKLLIVRSLVSESRTYPAQKFLTLTLDETFVPGAYQFHIVIREKGEIINDCIMRFEVTEG